MNPDWHSYYKQIQFTHPSPVPYPPALSRMLVCPSIRKLGRLYSDSRFDKNYAHATHRTTLPIVTNTGLFTHASLNAQVRGTSVDTLVHVTDWLPTLTAVVGIDTGNSRPKPVLDAVTITNFYVRIHLSQMCPTSMASTSTMPCSMATMRENEKPCFCA